MTNITLFKTMIDRYNEHAFTHEYIWGFEYKGNVYMAITTDEYMAHICKLDKASRGAGYSLRFRPTTAQKLMLIATGATVICSKEFFNDEVADSIYNKGEVYEKMVTEYFGLEWVKDSIPFTQAGDIEVDGIAYQIKYEGATFCNEKTLANLCK